MDAQRIATTIRWGTHRLTGVRRVLYLTPTVLALLVMLLLVAATTPRSIVYPVENIGFSVDGFWQLEFNGERSYRWTRGATRVRIPGFEDASLLLVSIHLPAPQRSGATSVPATVTTDKSAPMRFDIAPTWRTYHLLIDARSSDWRIPALTMIIPTWRPPAQKDDRDLGVVFGHMIVHRLLPSHTAAIAERLAFLGSLVALTAFATRRAPRLRVLPGVLTALLAMGALWAPVHLKQALPTNWQIVIGLAMITLCIEVFRHYRQRIPNNAFPIIGVVGVALGTSTVWMGWVIVGATMMICCSILAVYTRTFRGNHGMSDSSARPLSWRVWLIGFAIIAFAASVLVPQNDANSFHSDENTSQDTPT